eukprot:CAMPEP_0203670230 /NCGR_PEP_ID=MMETSP0090-20130426/6373_1 /ASSEMBLY_ACC=CAM_ASM_001088 /TAXON_ID=426623 /ORGANISM="Chaetoceros affinis, Strain CCMP159" /LENGTH=347 /DNA_ID=CAMNT_0050535053 /DNA_START=76 /DNA_END=1119 /DNA_ORIENTATION=-
MTFGWSQTSSYVDDAAAKAMTKKFIEFGKELSSDKYYIDTAKIYSGGKAEKILGGVLKDSSTYCDPDSVLVGTKAHPSQPNGLSREGIMNQFTASVKSMDVDAVGEFYLHQPDTDNSLLESLKCVNELIVAGKVKTLGLSNYHVSEVARAFELCEEHDLAKPGVYQGLYNPLNRAVEDELLPLLKSKGCSFVAYNPLAAGLLTGKHKRVDQDGAVMKGRFKNNQNYLPRFYTKENFDALELIKAACDQEGISLLQATFMWLLRHSALTAQDGVLLGASSINQLDQNLDACLGASKEDVTLSADILQAFNDAWEITKGSPFPYWRSYSNDMPGRESLNPGASYSAAKK